MANVMTTECVLSYMANKANQLVVCVREVHTCIEKTKDGATGGVNTKKFVPELVEFVSTFAIGWSWISSA